MKEMQRIICACIRNKNTGELVLGARHHNCYTRAGIFDYPHPDWEPGFIDQNETFYNRIDAWNIALKANQIINYTFNQTTSIPELYSENLY